jgi:phosphoenolpyruvate-protein kinase (PTS system EI component)
LHPSFECAGQPHCQRGRNRIIIAEELTPGLAVELEADLTIGFVTERGGPTSHAAILARAVGIPAVSGIGGIYRRISCGTEVLLNGDTGELVVWPTQQTMRRYGVGGRPRKRILSPVDPVSGLQVMANIRLAPDVSEAVEMKAEGVGLYRTEFEFITAGRVLDENEQLERYTAVIEAMAGHPVTFRLLDFGGDKLASFLDLPQQANPYLGLRGSSLLLARPELLAAQARALARASARAPIRVLYPMVVDAEQFLAVKEVFLKSTGDLNVENLQHGVLFEVPSACLEARRIFEVADFGSIGTNDLVQYLFAVDRNNELVAGAYNPGRQALWSMIGYVVRAANEAGRFLSVCGEAAGDPELLGAFTDAGIRSLSVSPRLISTLRNAAQARDVGAALP